MRTLHIKLRFLDDDYAELLYFFENPNQSQRRQLLVADISDLLQIVERDYYISLPEDFVKTGKRIYDWLDGSDRWLERMLSSNQNEDLVLAISTIGRLAYLPWEILHDGSSFLLQRAHPTTVPVRWAIDEKSSSTLVLSSTNAPANRALRVLFMAASPLGIKQPQLDYELEEGHILKATARQPLSLIVEESGCLEELGNLIASSERDYFDILHLTGHAEITEQGSCFLMETETGECHRASATEISKALQSRFPSVVFLSGCHTGQSGALGIIPSMAEELLSQGAQAVLAWGQPVAPGQAADAAAELYKRLSSAYTLAEAIAFTYQFLIEKQAEHWHLLRLYTTRTLKGALVTPLRTPGRQPAPLPSFSTKFLDTTAQRVKVPTRASFVGRRRQLQNCLRVLLAQSFEQVGVIIYGMGGLGKSSLASRLCDRFLEFEHLVWIGRIDETVLVGRLAEKIDNFQFRESLQNFNEELKFRLKRVFQHLIDQTATPFFLVLDDFEFNLESRPTGFVLLPEASLLLESIVWAIQETNSPHRLIITSRYDFESTQARFFYKQPLERLWGTDLQKKCERLSAFNSSSEIDATLKSRAIDLSDGNPRLLEWLDKILIDGSIDQNEILNRLELDPIELREQVLAQALLVNVDQPLKEMLGLARIFDLPVPKAVLQEICKTISNVNYFIDRAISLGLLEVSSDDSLRVPRILPIQVAIETSLYSQAARTLSQTWGKPGQHAIEAQVLEINRLAVLGQDKEVSVNSTLLLSHKWLMDLGRYRETAKICKQTLEVSNDYRILQRLAKAERRLGEVDSAINNYQQALELCPAEDGEERASILSDLADLKAEQGQSNEALELLEQVVEIAEHIGSKRFQAITLHQMGVIYAHQGALGDAFSILLRSLELQKEVKSARDQAATFHEIARIYVIRGELDQALSLFETALRLRKDTENLLDQVVTVHEIARIYVRKNELDRALHFFQRELLIWRNNGSLKEMASALHEIGVIHEKKGQLSEALPFLEESLSLEKQINNISGQVTTLNCIAGVYIAQNLITNAFKLYHQSLRLLKQVDHPQLGADIHAGMATAYLQQGDVAKAIDHFKKASKYAGLAGDLEAKAGTLAAAGRLIFDAFGNITTASKYYTEAIEILESINSPSLKVIKQVFLKIQQCSKKSQQPQKQIKNLKVEWLILNSEDSQS